MTFLDDREADMSAMFSVSDGFGESVTYAPKTGEPVTISALVHRGKESDGFQDAGFYIGLPVARNYRSDLGGGGRVTVATVWVQRLDISNPVYGDKIVFDDETWIVKAQQQAAAETGRGGF